MVCLILAALLLALMIYCRLRWDSGVQEWQVFAVWMALVLLFGCWGALELLGFRFFRFIGVPGSLLVFGLMAFVEFFPTFGAEQARGDERFLLVLGAPVLEDKATPCLTSRGECAARWMAAHPQTIAVLSGGKGGVHTEAQMLAQCIAAQGIDLPRLVLENRSTTTDENFQFARPVLEALGWQQEEPLVVVTNRFHVFRLRHYAQNSGYSNIRFLTTPTPHPVRFLWSLREVIVVCRWWILGE